VTSQAILFDAGGTLIHVDGERVLRAAGVDADSAAFSRVAGEAAVDVGAWTKRNPQSTDAERLPVYLDAILRRLGIADPDRRKLAARAVAAEHTRSNLWSHSEPGALETVRELRHRGYRTGVVSNADGRVRTLLDTAGFSPYLEVVIDSSEVGLEKPDPRIFLAATERLGIAPELCAYVGDIYSIDVVGARAAGMRPILIGSGSHSAEEGVERIERLEELLEMFPGLPTTES
jgi:putative hydrolase of the HAD superfamily